MTHTDPAEPATRVGRPRDAGRDADILAAALDILAEVGYDAMTVDMVAARAKAGKATLYRRWPSKPDLVLDAVARMKQVDPTDIPDTGTLRGDLVAMVHTPEVKDAERKLRILSGIVSLISQDPDFAEAARRALVEPRAAASRVILARAIERGEIPADADVERLAMLGPALASYRTLVLRQPVDREFLIRNIDEVILPAAFHRPGG